MSKQTSLMSFFSKRSAPSVFPKTEVKSEENAVENAAPSNVPVVAAPAAASPRKNLENPGFSDDEVALPSRKRQRRVVSEDEKDQRSPVVTGTRRDSIDSLAHGRMSLDGGSVCARRSSLIPAVSSREAAKTASLEERSALQVQVRDSNYWWQFVEAFFEGVDGGFEFPGFLDPRTLRDGHGRKPEHADFDETTLQVGNLKSHGFTPMHAQYWQVKSSGHMNELLLFKVGKFYEIFYTDAVIAQKALGLKWMGGGSAAANRAHVGFPEMSLETQAKQLVELTGLAVAVVEQTETVAEASERTGKISGALVQRDVNEVFTAATLASDADADALGAIILAVAPLAGAAAGAGAGGAGISVCVGDCLRGQFQTATLASLAEFRNLLVQTQPREILCASVLAPEVSRLTRPLGGRVRLIKWRDWPTLASPASAEGGLQRYLESLKQGALVASGVWRTAAGASALAAQGEFLEVNAAGVLQLELLRSSTAAGPSFEEFVAEGCVSAGGRRLMRRWVLAPLRRLEALRGRQTAVRAFVEGERRTRRTELREKLRKLPDLERAVQKICGWAKTKSREAVFFTDVEGKRLGFFLETLDGLRRASDALLGEFPEERSAQHVRELCEQLRSRVVKTTTATAGTGTGGASGSGNSSYEPARGSSATWEAIGAERQALERLLEGELERVNGELGTSGKYVSTKYKYEVEIAENKWRVEICGPVTSSRKGFVRFQTAEMQQCVERLETLEQKKRDALYPFMAELFQDFANHRTLLTEQLTERLNELDCVMTLAVISSNRDYVQPEFLLEPDAGGLVFELQDGRHPQLELRGDFVSNDVVLGRARPLVLTGPNMGGKSTVLRMTALVTILAQMGCYVPARKFRLTPVDKLFTRIGARDAILEGKSTFLVELEEAAALLNQGTVHSLALMDELGRGTSTHDGAAIAAATIDFVASEIQCRCIFSTHYDSVHVAQAENFRMAYSVEGERVQFRYKLESGRAESSQALNVARLAGIPEALLARARQVTARYAPVAV